MKRTAWSSLLFTVVLLATRFSADSAPLENPNQIAPASLTPQGTVVVHARQEITIKFEVLGDRLVNPVVVPARPEQPNTLTISYQRIGSDQAQPDQSAADTIKIVSRFPRPLRAECSYTEPAAPLPRRINFVPDATGLHRTFPRMLTEVTVSGFRLGPAASPQ